MFRYYNFETLTKASVTRYKEIISYMRYFFSLRSLMLSLMKTRIRIGSLTKKVTSYFFSL